MIAILRREWISSWRDRRGFWLRGLYAGVLMAGGTLLWMGYGAASTFQRVDFATMMWGFFRVLSFAQFLLITALGAVVCARTIVQEKESGALELLLLSRLTPLEMLAGKALAELIEAAFVLVAGLPVLGYLMMLGGISLADVASVHVILMAQLAFVAAIAIAFAVFLERFPGVMACTATVVAGVMLAALWRTPPAWLDAVLPSRVLQSELAAPGARIGASLASCGAALALLAVVVIGASFFLEWRVLTSPGRVPMSRGRVPSRAAAWVSSLAPVRRFFALRLRGRNPMLERDGRVGDRGRLALIVWYVVVLAVGVAAWPFYDAFVLPGRRSPSEFADVQVITALSWLAVVIFLSVLAAAMSMAGEKQRGLIEVLLAADVEPREILEAKLAGVWLRALYLSALPLAQLWIFAWDTRHIPEDALIAVRGTFALLVGMAAVPGALVAASRGRGMTFCASAGAVFGLVAVAVAAIAAAIPSLIVQTVCAAAVVSGALTAYAASIRTFRAGALR